MALVIDATLYLSGLRLLGIGRNQYIDLMNQCRSSKVREKKVLFDAAQSVSPFMIVQLC